MIKLANSKNPVIKGMNKHMYKKATKHVSATIDKYKLGLELITEEVSMMVIQDIEKHGSEVVSGGINYSEKNTVATVKIKFKPKYNTDPIMKRVSDYLERCREKKQINQYDYWFDEKGSFVAKISLK